MLLYTGGFCSPLSSYLIIILLLSNTTNPIIEPPPCRKPNSTMCKCGPLELSEGMTNYIDAAAVTVSSSSCKRNVKEAYLGTSGDESRLPSGPRLGKKRRSSITVEPVSALKAGAFATSRSNVPTTIISSKHVTFSDDTHTVIGRSDTSSTLEDLSRVWYQKSELATFKILVREHVLKTQLLSPSSSPIGGVHSQHPTTDMATTTTPDCQLDENDSIRGYERYNIERARQKTLARKITLIACGTSGLTDEDVAAIARKCSSSAGQQAAWTGCIDFCEVYLPSIDLKRSILPQQLHHQQRQSQQQV